MNKQQLLELVEVDKDKIAEYARYNGVLKGNLPAKLLDEWASAKSDYLSSIFKDKLILEFPFDIKATNHMLSEELYASSDVLDARAELVNSLKDLTVEFNTSYSLSELDSLFFVYHCTDYEVLAENATGEGIVYTFENLDKKPIRFQKGVKPMRALGKLVEALDNDIVSRQFENFRIIVSDILASRRRKGVFCLSIHPLDYITMSDNVHNWSSCTSWLERGRYKAGTIEMMTSNNMVVAYVKSSSRNLELGTEFKWNSKKWRQLVFVHPNKNLFVNSCPYPACIEEYGKICEQTLASLLGLGSDYMVEPYDEQENLEIETYYMYNDYVENQIDSYIVYNCDIPNERFNISGVPVCVNCGGNIEDSSSLVCEDCMS